MPAKVSVIVPVYNVERYLEKCLSSLVAQTLNDIGIIVVNDGSTDNSQEIIDRFAEAYPEKITALRQENKGPGAARNFGTAHARGGYVGFVDSDDWAEPEMFEVLYKTAEKEDADVVICDFCTVDEESGQCCAAGIWGSDMKKPPALTEIMLKSTNPAMAWNKLYKRSLIERHPFPDIYYEDVATVPVILSYCERVSVVPEPLYCYLKRSGAITSQRNNPRNLDVITAWSRCLTLSNPRFSTEIAYAVYFSLCYFLDARGEHMSEFFKFYWENESYFKENTYISKAISNRQLADLSGFRGRF